MGQRGKQASNVRALPNTEAPRLKPPIGTSKEFKKRFREIVNDWPGGFFKRTDIKPLCHYVNVELMMDDLHSKIYQEDNYKYLIGDEINKHLKLYQDLSRVLMAFSVKLRISASSRDRLIKRAEIKQPQGGNNSTRPMFQHAK